MNRNIVLSCAKITLRHNLQCTRLEMLADRLQCSARLLCMTLRMVNNLPAETMQVEYRQYSWEGPMHEQLHLYREVVLFISR